MPQAAPAVRDLLPPERISCARIRAALAEGRCPLGRWSTGPTDAIRPARLALLLRRYIWQAHDISLASVERQLAARGDRADYQVRIQVDVGGAAPLEVASLTRFARSPHGRVTARIRLCLGERPVAVTPLLLL